MGFRTGPLTSDEYCRKASKRRRPLTESKGGLARFLRDWPGVHLSIGTLRQTVHEADSAIALLEDIFLADAQASG